MLLEKSHQLVKQLVSHDIFRNIDKEALVKKSKVISDIYVLNTSILTSTEAQEQATYTIHSIPPEGIVISKEGLYIFSNDIMWSPTNNAAAITIQSSNVTLNLNSFTLLADRKDSKLNNIGINIINPKTVFLNPKKHQKVNQTKILNGKLKGMGLYGICAQTVTNFTLENITIEKTRYENLLQANASPAGIHINTAENITIDNCIVSDLEVTSSSCAGIQLLETENATLTNCTMDGFTNHDGSTQGYSYIGSKNINSINLVAKNFASHYKGLTQTMGHTVIGFCPWFSSHLQFTDCKSIKMIGCCDDCHGMSLFLTSNVTVTRFHAQDVLDGAGTNTGAKATGLEVYGINITIQDSLVENIKAIQPQDLQSTGYSAWGMNITLTNCTAKDVKVLDPSKTPNTAYGYGTGFGWAPDPRIEFREVPALFVKYDNCKAVDCQVGFDTWYHIDSTWETNISQENCEIPLLVQINGQRTLSGNKCSECPKPFTVTLTNIAKGNTYPEL